MLFYSYFKTLTGREVTVELKNDVAITGTLHSVDQYLNVKLHGVRVAAPEKHPQVSVWKLVCVCGDKGTAKASV